MPYFKYEVTVTAATAAEADKVMAERLQPDEDYGFDYTVDYGRSGEPSDLAAFRAEHPDRTGPRQAESRYAGIVVDQAWTDDVLAGISPDRALDRMRHRQATAYQRPLDQA